MPGGEIDLDALFRQIDETKTAAAKEKERELSGVSSISSSGSPASKTSWARAAIEEETRKEDETLEFVERMSRLEQEKKEQENQTKIAEQRRVEEAGRSASKKATSDYIESNKAESEEKRRRLRKDKEKQDAKQQIIKDKAAELVRERTGAGPDTTSRKSPADFVLDLDSIEEDDTDDMILAAQTAEEERLAAQRTANTARRRARKEKDALRAAEEKASRADMELTARQRVSDAKERKRSSVEEANRMAAESEGIRRAAQTNAYLRDAEMANNQANADALAREAIEKATAKKNAELDPIRQAEREAAKRKAEQDAKFKAETEEWLAKQEAANRAEEARKQAEYDAAVKAETARLEAERAAKKREEEEAAKQFAAISEAAEKQAAEQLKRHGYEDELEVVDSGAHKQLEVWGQRSRFIADNKNTYKPAVRGLDSFEAILYIAHAYNKFDHHGSFAYFLAAQGEKNIVKKRIVSEDGYSDDEYEYAFLGALLMFQDVVRNGIRQVLVYTQDDLTRDILLENAMNVRDNFSETRSGYAKFMRKNGGIEFSAQFAVRSPKMMKSHKDKMDACMSFSKLILTV